MARGNSTRGPRRTKAPPPPPVSDQRALLLAAALSLVAGSVYVLTAARDIVVGDTAEFITVALTFGVAHPSGYPLLTLLGHAFSWLPVGAPPFRVNLLGAVSSAVTVGLISLIARRLGATYVAAAVAALALAFHPLFWEWSLVIEAFPLNNLLAAAAVYFLIRWEEAPDRGRHLIAAAACCGLGASNHQTIVFLTPAIAIVLWRRASYVFTNRRLVLACTAAAAAGFLPYLTILWAASRHPFLNWGSQSSLGDLYAHFMRTAYGTGNLAAQSLYVGSPLDRVAAFARSFTLPEAVLVPLGAWLLYRRARWYFWATMTVAGVAGPAFAGYANLDVLVPTTLWVLQRFFLLPHVILAPLAAFGLMWISGRLSQYAAPARRPFVEGAVAVCVLAVVGAGIARDYRRLDLSRNHVARTFAEDVLATLKPNAVLMTMGDEVALPVAYLQAVEGRRPDVTLLMLGVIRGSDWYIRQLRSRQPPLVVPFDRYNRTRPSSTVKAIVDANPGRPFALIGDALDTSLQQSHWFYRRGVLGELQPMATNVSLDTMTDDNERLLGMYKPPQAATIRQHTFEIVILRDYAIGAKLVGDEYARAGLTPQARRWYERAMSIDPGFGAAGAAIAALPR